MLELRNREQRNIIIRVELVKVNNIKHSGFEEKTRVRMISTIGRERHIREKKVSRNHF